MARPKKPTELKRRLGNPGKRRLAEPGATLPMVKDMPEPFWPLGKDGRAAWRHGRASLAASDAMVVQLYADATDDYVALRNELHERGFADPALWRERKQLLDLANQVNDLAKALGLSPAGRAQLGVAEVPTQEDLAHLHDLGAPTLVPVDEHLLNRPSDELTARTLDAAVDRAALPSGSDTDPTN